MNGCTVRRRPFVIRGDGPYKRLDGEVWSLSMRVHKTFVGDLGSCVENPTDWVLVIEPHQTRMQPLRLQQPSPNAKHHTTPHHTTLQQTLTSLRHSDGPAFSSLSSELVLGSRTTTNCCGVAPLHQFVVHRLRTSQPSPCSIFQCFLPNVESLLLLSSLPLPRRQDCSSGDVLVLTLQNQSKNQREREGERERVGWCGRMQSF